MTTLLNLVTRPNGRRSGLTNLSQHQPFLSLHKEMNQIFNDLLGTLDTTPASTLFKGRWPQVDVRETANEIIIDAELPGIDEKDLEITLKDDYLTLQGEKKVEKKDENEEGFYHSERAFGSFSRTIPLPAEVDRENIAATFKNGVLKIRLPKTEKAKNLEHKINVKSE